MYKNWKYSNRARKTHERVDSHSLALQIYSITQPILQKKPIVL